MNIKKTSNLLLNFATKRLAEIFGIIVFMAGTMLLAALITYSPDDPNFIFPQNTKINNKTANINIIKPKVSIILFKTKLIVLLANFLNSIN